MRLRSESSSRSGASCGVWTSVNLESWEPGNPGIGNRKQIKKIQNFLLVLGMPGRVFGGPGTEKTDFEEIGVAGPEPEPAPREERERRARSLEGSRKPST